MKNIAIVVPILNEEKSILNNILEIKKHSENIPNIYCDIFAIDDGSIDKTAVMLNELSSVEESINLVCLNRNFGKEAAITAGLNLALEYDAVIVMDSDLQHPPALIGSLIKHWQQGFEVVEAVKIVRNKESYIKSFLVSVFYYLFNTLTKLNIKNHTDFKLLDKKVVKEYCYLSEQKTFFRGLVQWMNYSTAQVPFEVPERIIGTSSWHPVQLIKYAISSITSFTSFPLHIITILGGGTFIISIIISGIALYDKVSGNAVDGFTTVILLILIVGSILMLSIGLIGSYVANIYDEIKSRPKYIVNTKDSNIRGKNG